MPFAERGREIGGIRLGASEPLRGDAARNYGDAHAGAAARREVRTRGGVTVAVDAPFGHNDAARRRRLSRVALPALALVPLFVALAISALGGGLSIPHNDGWAYAKVAESFAHDLDFSLVGWNRPGLVGQVLLAAPATLLLPNAVVAQHLTVWLLAVLLVLAVYWFCEPALGAARAALAAAVTGAFPALGLLSTSFMADVPSASLGMLCLAAGARVPALLPRRAGVAWLAASIALGVLAGVTREQALAAPVAVLLWLGSERARQRSPEGRRGRRSRVRGRGRRR